MNKRPLEKYLTKRAVSGPWQLSPEPTKRYRGAVVIPSLAEGDDLFATLNALTLSDEEHLQQTAIVVVVNQREDASPEQKQVNTADLDRLLLHVSNNTIPNLYIVDAISKGLCLGKKDGVGLARKIGFDLALTLLDGESKHPKEQPILISLDADTIVDHSYLASIYRHFTSNNDLAAELPFAHRLPADDSHRMAITIYELFLRLHLEGLLLATSPYAFHTIGSAFACTADAYIKAGGMKLRQGGEDFYFLQQVRKIGQSISTIGRVQGTCVQPSARLSTRAPFGTGPALGRILDEGFESWGFYPLTTYQILGSWLEAIAKNPTDSAMQLLLRARDISVDLHAYLLEINFDDFWQKNCVVHSNIDRRIGAFHDWFDGLKSLRLIHHLCGLNGRIDVYRALKEFTPLLTCDKDASLSGALDYLRERQGVDIQPQTGVNRPILT